MKMVGLHPFLLFILIISSTPGGFCNGPPDCPANLSVRATGPDYVTLQWTSTTSLPKSNPYEVNYQRTGSSEVKSVTINGVWDHHIVTLKIEGLKPSTNYSLNVTIKTVQCPDSTLPASTERCDPVFSSPRGTSRTGSFNVTMPSLDKDGPLEDFLILTRPHKRNENNNEEDYDWTVSVVQFNPGPSIDGNWTVELPHVQPDTRYDVELWSQACWNRVFQAVKRDGHQVTCHESTLTTILFIVGIAASLVVVIFLGMACCLICMHKKSRRHKKQKINQKKSRVNQSITPGHSAGNDSMYGYSEIIAVESSSSRHRHPNSSSTSTSINTDINNTPRPRMDSEGYTTVRNTQENEYMEVNIETPLQSVEGYTSLFDIPGTGRLDSEYNQLNRRSCVLDRESRAYQKIGMSGTVTKSTSSV